MDVLGFDVPSTAPMFLVVLAAHVAASLVAVVSGAGAMLARPKSQGRHTRWGKVYFPAICLVCGTGTVLAVMRLRQDSYLLPLAALTFALAAAGRKARRRHGDGAHITAMGGSYVVMLTAFYVDNGHRLPLWDRLPTLAYWLIPTVVGAPLIWRAVHRAGRGDPHARDLRPEPITHDQGRPGGESRMNA